MKKSQELSKGARKEKDFFNFVKKNEKIIQNFRQLNKLESKYSETSKKADHITGNSSLVDTERYNKKKQTNKEELKDLQKRSARSLRDILFETEFRNKISVELPINQRKSQPKKTGKNHQNKTQRQAETIFHQERMFQEDRLPRIGNQTPFSSERNFPAHHKNILIAFQERQRERRLHKNSQISINNSRKTGEQLREEEVQKAKARSLNFATINKTKLSKRKVQLFYDCQTLQKDKELIPSSTPLKFSKRQPITLPQLEDQFRGQMELFFGISRNKKEIIQSVTKEQLEDKNQELKSKLLDKKFSQKGKKPNLPLKKMKKQSVFNFIPEDLSIYEQKMKSYRQFLFLVNFVHRIYDPLILNDFEKHKNFTKYKFYIGKGNNKFLIKSLMKRRFWWVQVDDPKQANFVWTQLKINTYYQYQKKSFLEDKYDKLDENFQLQSPKLKKIKSLPKKIALKTESPEKKTGGIVRGSLPQGQKKLFTKADRYQYKKMFEKAEENTEKLSKFAFRLKCLPENFLKQREKPYEQCRVHNHFSQNYFIGNKKALFYNLRHYYNLIEKDVYTIIPLTFHIKKGTSDPQYTKFVKQFKRLKEELKMAEKTNTVTKKTSKNVWIVKPGELSNRGNGITVIDELYQLNTILKTKTKHTNGTQKTYIVQKYIEKPLLYKSRKFDIRHFMIMSRLHGRLRAYWFSEGYIRTSSYEYNIEEVCDEMIHLTNDAIQKGDPNYGKYEEGNKISYAEFQRYIDSTYPQKKYSFADTTYKRMRQIATDAIKATYLQMDPDTTEHNFEIFGLDFMIDSQFNVWLIEVNTNPCLELSSNLLSRIIPNFIENTFRLTLDPIFPPPTHYPNIIKYLVPDNPMDRLQFQLIFDQARDGKDLEILFENAGKVDYGQIDEEDETFENDGKEIDLGGQID